MELSKSLTFKIYLKIKLPTSIIIPAGCQKINIKIVKNLSMAGGFMCNNVQESKYICVFHNKYFQPEAFLSVTCKPGRKMVFHFRADGGICMDGR